MISDDQIIEMAKQVGYDFYPLHRHEMLAFARLIAEKQKEIDAVIVETESQDSSRFEFADAIRGQK